MTQRVPLPLACRFGRAAPPSLGTCRKENQEKRNIRRARSLQENRCRRGSRLATLPSFCPRRWRKDT